MGMFSRNAPAWLFLAVPAFAQNYDERERALAANLRTSLNGQISPYDNPAAADYVSRIAAQLTGSGANYTFEIVQTAAFEEPASLLDAHVLIPKQFFVKAQDESEFAAIIAHAIEHVEQRHFVRMHGSARIYFPLHIGLVPMGAREQHAGLEHQADSQALQRLVKAGLDPFALRRYVARTQPHDAQRLGHLEEQLRGMPTTAVQNPVEFERIRESVRESLPLSRKRRPPTLRREGEVIP